MKKFLLIVLIVNLSGCVGYQWVKPGADKSQEDMAETECKAQALRDLPPDNVISGKYTSQDKKHKSTDTSYSTSDANESKRYTLVKDCMYRKGWKQIEVKY